MILNMCEMRDMLRLFTYPNDSRPFSTLKHSDLAQLPYWISSKPSEAKASRSLGMYSSFILVFFSRSRSRIRFSLRRLERKPK